MNILVTGGAGFIGSHIVERLVREGHYVSVVDNFSTGKISNIPPEAMGKIRLIHGDLATMRHEDICGAEPEVICHQAAIPSVPKSIDDPTGNLSSNFMATMNVLWAAQKHGVRRVVLASSAAVYGKNSSLASDESESALEPASPYGAAKAACEMFACAAAAHTSLETACLRYFNVYGPRQDPSSGYSGVISKLCAAASTTGEFVIYGDGEQTRDFVYVDDVVSANVAAITEPRPLKDARINVATGGSISLNELVDAVQEVSGKAINVTYADQRAGDIKHSSAKVLLAKFFIGFKAKTALKDGLRETLAWYSANHKSV